MLDSISAMTFEEWKAFYKVKNWEQEQQAKKAKRGR